MISRKVFWSATASYVLLGGALYFISPLLTMGIAAIALLDLLLVKMFTKKDTRINH